MKWKIISFILGLIILLITSTPVISQSQTSIEISDIDARDFPIVRLVIGVWDVYGQSIPNLRETDFNIFEDQFPPRKPKSVVLKERLGGSDISLVVDLNPQQRDSIRKFICTVLSQEINLDQRKNADRVEVWIPGYGYGPALPFTNDSGNLCNFISNTPLPAQSLELTFNGIIERLLTRSFSQHGYMIFLFPAGKIEQTVVSHQQILALPSKYPRYVFSFMNPDESAEDWNYMLKLASFTQQGVRAVVDLYQASPRSEQEAIYLIRDSYRFRSRYLVEYHSSLPRSASTHSVRVQVGSASSPETTFTPSTQGDADVGMAWRLGVVLLLMFVFLLSMAIWSLRNNSSFTFP